MRFILKGWKGRRGSGVFFCHAAQLIPTSKEPYQPATLRKILPTPLGELADIPCLPPRQELTFKIVFCGNQFRDPYSAHRNSPNQFSESVRQHAVIKLLQRQTQVESIDHNHVGKIRAFMTFEMLVCSSINNCDRAVLFKQDVVCQRRNRKISIAFFTVIKSARTLGKYFNDYDRLILKRFIQIIRLANNGQVRIVKPDVSFDPNANLGVEKILVKSQSAIISKCWFRGVAGPLDLQIASIAALNGLIHVTSNTREFTRISGLQVEDWSV